MTEELAITPEENARIDELVTLADNITKQMAEEWFLAQVTHDWTTHSRLRSKWQLMNTELSNLLRKQDDL